MTETDSPNIQPARLMLTEAALLAAFPAYSVYLAFNYEAGIARFYGYPKDLISISFESIFIAGGALLGILITLLITANIFYMVFPDNRQKYLPYFTPLLVSIIFMLSVVMTIEIDSKYFFLYIVAILFFPMIVYLPPLFSMKKYGGYMESLEASEMSEEPIRRRSLIGRFSLRVGRHNFFGLIILVFILPFVAGNLGHRDARQKISYLVFELDQEFVVLKIYGKTMIATPLNRKEKVLERKFFLRPVISNTTVAYKMESVGPLTLKE